MSNWLVALFLLSVASISFAGTVSLPDDPRAVADLQREFGAKGDGVTDDTEAFEKAIATIFRKGPARTIFVPNGTYRLTRPIVLTRTADGSEGSMVGPWIYGQDRDKTILRLDDGATGFGDVNKPLALIRAIARPDGARMNADFFDRTLRNFTLDTGNNPGAIGIQFYSNNTGILGEVTIRGNGTCGIDLGFVDQNGPMLVQDVSIDGYAIGISTAQGLNSQTFSRVTIRAREVGLRHRSQVIAAEALDISGAPLAIDLAKGGVLSLVDSKLTAPPGTTGPAIKVDDACLYAARVTTSGFKEAISATNVPQKYAAGPVIKEYASHGIEKLGSPSIKPITPLREPQVPYPTNPKDWVCVNDFGANNTDENDDSEAFQKAIDHAAKIGAKAVYLFNHRPGDPNWFWLKKDVRVHGSVERIMGFGFIRILGGESKDPTFPENLGKFVVDKDPKGAKVVIFQHLNVFSTWPTFGIEAKDPGRVVVVNSCGGQTLIVRPGVTAFLTNSAALVVQQKGSKLFIRQYNTEGAIPNSNTLNDGGELWILGMKTEHFGTKLVSKNGARTEVLGVHNYNTTGVKDQTPFFVVQDASLSVSGYREMTFSGAWWKSTVILNEKGKIEVFKGKDWQTWSLLQAGR